MGPRPNLELLVLHGLRLSGFAPADVVAERWSLEVAEVTIALESAQSDGWVIHRDGRLTGWMLSAKGRTHAEDLVAAELDASGVRAQAERSYEEFEPLNVEFLSICTDWQLRDVDGEQTINDHTDVDHDRAVVERLESVHPAVVAIVDDLAARLERFRGYAPRFDRALGRVRANDVDWLTKPVIDSYHTVWFELHEDLLATLGRSRSPATAQEE
jgi:hypothetical protein